MAYTSPLSFFHPKPESITVRLTEMAENRNVACMGKGKAKGWDGPEDTRPQS